MKHLALFFAALLLAGSACASDIVANAAHKHYLKASHSECDTPSGKASRQCSHAQSANHASKHNF